MNLFRSFGNRVALAGSFLPGRLWLWGCIGFLAGLEAAWLLITPLGLNEAAGTFLLNLAVVVAFGVLLANYCRRWPRLHTVFGGFTFLMAAWPILRLFNHLTMTLGFPLADAQLAQWDARIGFDWAAYLHWVDRQPMIIDAMAATYTNLTLYSCLLFLLLACGPQPQQRCTELISLFLVTALACTTIGMAFPALAAMTYYNPPAGAFEHFDGETGSYHLSALMELRSNSAHRFDFAKLPGLVTFPSFHTAMGVIAIYCARRSLWLLVPMLAVNVMMIASTPVFGSHYGIDVIAGALVTFGVILVYRHMTSGGLVESRRLSMAPGIGRPEAGLAS